MMDNFWISFCGQLDEGYKPDFRISKNKPDSYEGYINIHVYTSDFIEELKAENARYRKALEFYADDETQSAEGSNYTFLSDAETGGSL